MKSETEQAIARSVARLTNPDVAFADALWNHVETNYAAQPGGEAEPAPILLAAVAGQCVTYLFSAALKRIATDPEATIHALPLVFGRMAFEIGAHLRMIPGAQQAGALAFVQRMVADGLTQPDGPANDAGEA